MPHKSSRGRLITHPHINPSNLLVRADACSDASEKVRIVPMPLARAVLSSQPQPRTLSLYLMLKEIVFYAGVVVVGMAPVLLLILVLFWR
jgi:hypothetical protein